MNKLFTVAICVCAFAATTQAATIIYDFDESNALNNYETADNVNFSDNASIWTHGASSVLVNPNGGAYSGHSALQFGNAGGVLGSIEFNQAINFASIMALSGPGPDTLSTGIYVKAYNTGGQLVGMDFANDTLQYDELTLSGSSIVKIEFYSPYSNNDLWDQLIFTTQPVPQTGGGSEPGNGDPGNGQGGEPNVPEPASAALLIVATALMAQRRK